MPRPLRVEYAGAIYHVINRGNQRQDIFRDDQDRKIFLDTLGEACVKTEWQVHAYCLMRNHFHLVMETPQANLVTGMKWLLGVYTKRFNIRHKTCGHLFAGRYKALLVDGSGNGYLETVCDYVHLNPVRARLIAAEAGLESFPWSSYPQYLQAPRQRRPWLRVERIFGAKGIRKDTEAGRREFALRMEIRCRQEQSANYDDLRRGWSLGSEEFRRELLAGMSERLGPHHYGSQRQESGAEKAERLVREGLAAVGWEERELGRQRKGHPVKVEIARVLRRETTMTLAWIAQRLEMGTWTYVSNLVALGGGEAGGVCVNSEN
jgi:REP element-mobilizing transposase RayT